MSELDGMPALIEGVRNQTWPHTVDPTVWAKEWLKTLAEHPGIATDEGAMIAWFSNAIMAGYDTATYGVNQPSPTAQGDA